MMIYGRCCTEDDSQLREGAFDRILKAGYYGRDHVYAMQ